VTPALCRGVLFSTSRKSLSFQVLL
jgi:hypothetical protein